MRFETAVFQWEDGLRRLGEAGPGRVRTLERVVGAIVDELRRRLGGAFTTAELTDLYERGTDWCLDLAISVAPQDPDAWSGPIVIDAAFGRYVREAVDFAGGRRLS